MDWSKLARVIIKKLEVLSDLEEGSIISQAHIEAVEELTELIDFTCTQLAQYTCIRHILMT